MEVNIIGDLNCNVGATSPDCSTLKLLDICDSYQYRQLIDQPTRITQLKSSIIDLFLTNHPWNFSDSGVTDIGISDHCLVYVIRKTVTSRCFKNFIPDSFRTDLSMEPWHLIEQEHNPNIAWDIWQHIVTHAGNNNLHSKSPTVNGLITGLLTFSLTAHVKPTRAHTHLHHVGLLFYLYYEHIAYSLLAVTVFAFVRASHSNTTVIYLARASLLVQSRYRSRYISPLPIKEMRPRIESHSKVNNAILHNQNRQQQGYALNS